MEFITPTKRNEVFYKEYEKLNTAQRAAVDAIYGPVLVLAGPGTGKTQLLALRVCNILIKTDYQPQNILCLTYTDAGVTAMRKRLLKFMGSDAHLVNIYTYHSFCHKIIRENKDVFNNFIEFEMADEVDQTEAIIKIIDDLPMDDELKRNIGEVHYDKDRFKELFDTMKKERLSSTAIAMNFALYEDKLRNGNQFLYKSSGKKGLLNEKELQRELDKYKFAINGSYYLKVYDNILRSKKLIDFNDAINFVVDQLKKNEDLRLRYQEQFQFILVDEYQDTNESQNEIVFQLGNYDDRPNIFVVGDDDQSIYRFQGANMANISTFIEKYQPEFIVLSENYRSHKSILEKAKSLINYNKERIATGDHKLLNQARPLPEDFPYGVFLKQYANVEAQEIGLVKQIISLHESGVPFGNMAIIYRAHKDVERLVKYFMIKNIPINVKKKVNVLEEPEGRRLINMLEYVYHENISANSRKNLLFEILHYDFWNLHAIDISKLAIYARTMKDDKDFDGTSWREIMMDQRKLEEAGVQDVQSFIAVSKTLESLIDSGSINSLQTIIEKILTLTNWINTILKSNESTYRIQLINTLFEYAKELTTKDGKLNIEGFLSILKKRINFNIGLNFDNIIEEENGVNFITSHSSKGLEYEHVFILNATEKNWIKSIPNKVNIPPIKLDSVQDNSALNIEESRRLFFVALTRSEKTCTILYPNKNEKNKDEIPVRFINEMGFDPEIKSEKITNEEVEDYLSKIMSMNENMGSLIDHKFIDKSFPSLVMNATGVSKYLECPIRFYFENIIKVPGARKPMPGYGNALHYALDKFAKEVMKYGKAELPAFAVLEHYFDKGMQKFESHFTQGEYNNYKHEGTKALKLYYDQYQNHWFDPIDIITEKYFESVMEGVPIKGIIDKIDVYENGIEIKDYKTGHENSAKLAKPNESNYGGDYWRQAVFYKILLNHDMLYKNKLKRSTLQYINTRNESGHEKEINITEYDVKLVKEQIHTVYNSIRDHKFETGCNDCKWCSFVNNDVNDN